MTDLNNATITAMGIPCTLPRSVDVSPDGKFTGASACRGPSIALASFACVHGHFDTPNVCTGCASDLQRSAGDLTCPRCEDDPEPHECLMTVWIAWFDGSPVTVVQEARR
jgi:hypothetical protein